MVGTMEDAPVLPPLLCKRYVCEVETSSIYYSVHIMHFVFNYSSMESPLRKHVKQRG